MKKRLVAAILATSLIISQVCLPAKNYLPLFAITAEAVSSVSSPKASLDSGKYCVSDYKNVTLTCSDKNAKIYYSVNSAEYKLYSSAITLTKNTVLEAYASAGGKKSKTVSYEYSFTPKLSVNVNGGKYNSSQNVKFTSKLSGVKLYYTTDGTKPTTASAKYTSKGIVVDKSCTLRVLAVKSDFDSKLYSYVYEISKLSAKNAESFLDDYTKKYYYSTMDKKQKKMYKRLYDGLLECKTKIDFSDMNIGYWDFNYVWWLFTYDNPQIFWADVTSYEYTEDSGKIYDILIKYTIKGKASIKKTGDKIDKKTSAVLKKAELCDNTYDKVLLFHDFLTESIDYIMTNKIAECSVTGAFVNGKAQCEGYAKAFAYLCQSAGIPCFVITGKAGNDDHAWNLTEIDGKWYHIDVTWDDPIGGVPCHNYLCLSEKQISSDHEVGTWFPRDNSKAVSTDLNYPYTIGCKIYGNAKDAYNALLKSAVKNYDKGKKSADVYYNAKCSAALEKLIYNNIDNDLNDAGVEHINCYYTIYYCPYGYMLRLDIAS